jgi:predicted transcriptional regulator
MSTITLHLPDNLALELAQVGQETSRTPEAVAEEMLRRMIAIQRFDRLRAEVRQAADNSSPLSEDDILNEIS